MQAAKSLIRVVSMFAKSCGVPCTFGNDTKGTFRANEQFRHIYARGRLAGSPARLDDLAVRKNYGLCPNSSMSRAAGL